MEESFRISGTAKPRANKIYTDTGSQNVNIHGVEQDSMGLCLYIGKRDEYRGPNPSSSVVSYCFCVIKLSWASSTRSLVPVTASARPYRAILRDFRFCNSKKRTKATPFVACYAKHASNTTRFQFNPNSGPLSSRPILRSWYPSTQERHETPCPARVGRQKCNRFKN